MSQEINRLLMALERNRQHINRDIINPCVSELTLDGLEPVLRLVAHARARYLEAWFNLGEKAQDRRPTAEEFTELTRLRTEYEELVKAAQAMETAIQRGYLDVKEHAR